MTIGIFQEDDIVKASYTVNEYIDTFLKDVENFMEYSEKKDNFEEWETEFLKFFNELKKIKIGKTTLGENFDRIKLIYKEVKYLEKVLPQIKMLKEAENLEKLIEDIEQDDTPKKQKNKQLKNIRSRLKNLNKIKDESFEPFKIALEGIEEYGGVRTRKDKIPKIENLKISPPSKIDGKKSTAQQKREWRKKQLEEENARIDRINQEIEEENDKIEPYRKKYVESVENFNNLMDEYIKESNVENKLASQNYNNIKNNIRNFIQFFKGYIKNVENFKGGIDEYIANIKDLEEEIKKLKNKTDQKEEIESEADQQNLDKIKEKEKKIEELQKKIKAMGQQTDNQLTESVKNMRDSFSKLVKLLTFTKKKGEKVVSLSLMLQDAGQKKITAKDFTEDKRKEKTFTSINKLFKMIKKLPRELNGKNKESATQILKREPYRDFLNVITYIYNERIFKDFMLEQKGNKYRLKKDTKEGKVSHDTSSEDYLDMKKDIKAIKSYLKTEITYEGREVKVYQVLEDVYNIQIGKISTEGIERRRKKLKQKLFPIKYNIFPKTYSALTGELSTEQRKQNREHLKEYRKKIKKLKETEDVPMDFNEMLTEKNKLYDEIKELEEESKTVGFSDRTYEEKLQRKKEIRNEIKQKRKEIDSYTEKTGLETEIEELKRKYQNKTKTPSIKKLQDLENYMIEEIVPQELTKEFNPVFEMIDDLILSTDKQLLEEKERTQTKDKEGSKVTRKIKTLPDKKLNEIFDLIDKIYEQNSSQKEVSEEKEPNAISIPEYDYTKRRTKPTKLKNDQKTNIEDKIIEVINRKGE
ncbi:hypothetical protein QKV95_gp099 [Poseidoniales virus YSH_150918]|uniref:Uncharacterized protein n=1 Tax=Poseidoniales virus YSH_150918 TaxID=3071324 RepID=A0A976YF96_9CAUD|nr:hypothetical protein QKV95_gp099 [Yangshan Harbor Poseidoniales virus]UVF62576.1 hypothetical protein [Poseidoniales virus YSH_150918]